MAPRVPALPTRPASAVPGIDGRCAPKESRGLTASRPRKDYLEAYLGLFAAAFIAATLLPFYSEVALAGLQAAGYDPIALWCWATAGNTLGAAVNWGMGRWLLHYQDRPWFPFRPERLGPAQRWYQRWGVWSLLLAWLPIGGDALTFIAGLMRVNFLLFFVLTAIGKGARYAVVLGVAGWLFG